MGIGGPPPGERGEEAVHSSCHSTLSIPLVGARPLLKSPLQVLGSTRSFSPPWSYRKRSCPLGLWCSLPHDPWSELQGAAVALLLCVLLGRSLSDCWLTQARVGRRKGGFTEVGPPAATAFGHPEWALLDLFDDSSSLLGPVALYLHGQPGFAVCWPHGQYLSKVHREGGAAVLWQCNGVR